MSDCNILTFCYSQTGRCCLPVRTGGKAHPKLPPALVLVANRIIGEKDGPHRFFELLQFLPARLHVIFPGYTQADANRDMGDSAIMETGGLGAFAMAASPLWPSLVRRLVWAGRGRKNPGGYLLSCHFLKSGSLHDINASLQ